MAKGESAQQEGAQQEGGSVPGDRLLALAIAAAHGFRSLSLSADGGYAEDVVGALCWYSSSYVPMFNGASLFSS